MTVEKGPFTTITVAEYRRLIERLEAAESCLGLFLNRRYRVPKYLEEAIDHWRQVAGR